MARGNYMQNSFLSGEWSPFSQGRTNEEAYYAGLNLCLNHIVTDTGALPRRSGTRFSAHAKTHTGLISLLEFISETSDALVVELTDLIARFHRAGTLLVDDNPPEVLSISTATPAVVVTRTAHGWSTGNTVVFQQLGSSAAAPLFNRQFTITVLSSTSFSLAHTAPLSGSVDGTTIDGAEVAPLQAARVTERTTPYTAAQVADVKYTEEQDTLYLFHPLHEIRTIDRTALPVTEQELLDGPYFDENTTATTLTFSGTSGSVTVTASSTTGINGGSGFQTTDIGRSIRVNTGSVSAPAWSWLKITARTSTTVVTATVRGANLSSAAANTKWRLGLYCDTTGWPVHGVIHEGRLWLVGATGRVDGSKTFSYFNFEPTAADGTVADDNAVSAVFAGSGRQTPRWLQSIETGLLIGTDGGEYRARASSFDDPITPFTVQVRRMSAYGVADVLPRTAGRNSLFVQSLGRSIYEYRFNGNGFLNSADIARDARHLTSRGIVDLAYVSEPIPVLWALRGDGRLVATTYRFDNEDEERLNAWHRHSVEYDRDVALGEDEETGTAIPYLRGGQSTTEGGVYSIACAPFSDPEGSRNDLVWMAVQRGDVVCVEYMTPIFDETFIDNEAFFVDSGNLYRQEDFGITWVQVSEGTYIFYGLDRLEGDTVDVAFRGVDLGTAVVTSGAVTVALPDELDQAESAYEFSSVTIATGGALSFASGFISNVEEDVLVRQKVFNPAQAFAVAPDGRRYFTARPKTGSANGIYLIEASTGALAAIKTSTDITTDMAAGLVEPPGGWVGASPTAGEFSYVIPGTKYVIVDVVDSAGASVNHGWAYYQITSAGGLQFIGGMAEDPTGTSFQFVPGDEFDSQNMMAQGVYTGVATPSDLTVDSPILLAGYAETKSIVVPLPSPEYILDNTPVNVTTAENVQARSINITTAFPTFDHLFENQNGGELVIRGSQGFFLPGPGNTTYLFSYVNQELMEEHAGGTASVTVPALTTQAAISTDPVIVEATITGSDHTDLRIISMNVNGGDRFENFPFPDIGEAFGGGAGTSELNDYGNASVFPSDVTDPKKPWYVFFPRVYPDAPDNTDKLGIRAYLWEPEGGSDGRGYATHLSFASGKLYDVVTDDLPATQSFGGHVSIYWDRSNNNLYVLSTGAISAASDTVVSLFGTFVPSTGQISVVDDSHIDAIIGLNYHSRFQLLRPDAGSGAANGPGLGKSIRTDQFALLTYRSGGLFIGADAFDDLKPVVLSGTDDLGRRPLFTGVHHDALQADYNFDNMIIGEYRRPYPGAIAAISGFSSKSDR